jgi:hypothetical protein
MVERLTKPGIDKATRAAAEKEIPGLARALKPLRIDAATQTAMRNAAKREAIAALGPTLRNVGGSAGKKLIEREASKRFATALATRAATTIGAGSVAGPVGNVAGAAAFALDTGRAGTEMLYNHKLHKGNTAEEQLASLRRYALKYFNPNGSAWRYYTMGNAQQQIDDYVNSLNAQDYMQFMKEHKAFHDTHKRGLWGWSKK